MKHKPKYWPAFCNRSATCLTWEVPRSANWTRNSVAEFDPAEEMPSKWITARERRDAEEKWWMRRGMSKLSDEFQESSSSCHHYSPAGQYLPIMLRDAMAIPQLHNSLKCVGESMTIKSRASHNYVNFVIKCHRGAARLADKAEFSPKSHHDSRCYM